MEENIKRKSNLKKIIIGLLFLLVGLILIYFAYSSSLKDDNSNNNDNNQAGDTDNNNQSELEEKINSIVNDYDNLTEYFNQYIEYVPIRYENSNLASYTALDLTDQEISMAIWRYIYYQNDGLLDTAMLTVEEVNLYLKEYLNLDNYEIQELEKNDESPFGLKLQDDNYVISANQTDFSFVSFEVVDVNTDYSTNKVLVYANQLDNSSENLGILNTITLELQYNDDYFNIVSFTVNE